MLIDKDKNTKEEKIEAIDRGGNTVFVGTFQEVIEAIKTNAELGVKVIHVWLAAHPRPENPTDPIMIFQQRSDNGRLDKFVGGHVSHGETFDETVLREAEEEMGGLSVKIVNDLGSKALASQDLTTSAAIMAVSGMPWDVSRRYDRDNVYDKPTRVMTYVGFYDGDLVNIEHDFEVTGVKTMPLSEALQGIHDNPELFTPDVVKHLPQIADTFESFIRY